MDRLRVSSLYWAVGAYFTLVGTLLLVTPHIFQGGLPTILFTEPLKIGFAFLLAGFLLLSLAVVTPPAWMASLGFLMAALLLGTMALDSANSGHWIEIGIYSASSLACLGAAFSPRIWRYNRPTRKADLLAFCMGLGSIGSGVAILFMVQQRLPVGQLLNISALLFGTLMIAAGFWLSVVQINGIRKHTSVLTSAKPAIWGSYLFQSLILLGFAGAVLVSGQRWVTAALFGICGMALASMPFYPNFSEKYAPRSLSIRLALIMAVITCLPLVTIAAVSGEFAEQATARQALRQLQIDAINVSLSIGEINSQHQSALLAAAQSELLALDFETQSARLAGIAAAYPEISAVTLYQANGQPLASSRGASSPVTGTPLYQIVQASAHQTQSVYYSPDRQEPIFTYGTPLLDHQGQLSGLLTFELPAAEIAGRLETLAQAVGGRVFLVSGQGQVILHPENKLVETRSINPAVNVLLSHEQPNGALEYRQNGERNLAGFSLVPGSDWGVVVEQPAEAALVGVYQGRLLALGLIGLSILAAAVAGTAMGGWVTSPLQSLAGSIRALADGNYEASLPETRFTEGQALIDTFGGSRRQIASRFANREQALDVLRITRKVLDQQVTDKARSLEAANQQIVEMYDQVIILQKDRALIEKSLRESELRLHVLGESFPFGIWLADAKGRLLYTSQSYLNLLNMTLEEARLFGWTRRLNAQDVNPVMKNWVDCITSGKSLDCEYRINNNDGKAHWLKMIGRPVRDENGNINFWTGVHLDLTDQKSLEQQLASTQEHFRVAISHSPVVIYENDCNLVYTWVSAGAGATAPEDWIGKRDEELNPAWNVNELVAIKQAVLQTQKGIHKEINIDVDNRRLFLDLTIEPCFSPEGNVQGIIVASMDVTEKKRLEEELERNIIQIELQHRVNDQHEIERIKFARDLHDGPLQDLIAVTFQLQQTIFQTQDPPTKEKLQGLQNALQQQVRNMRTLSFAMRPPILSRFGLAKATQSFIENFSARYPEIKLNSELMEDGQLLPERVRAALFRICQEALANVVKHSQAKEVWLRLHFEGGLALLDIQDDGIGFTPPGDWLSLARDGHLGLAGISERVEALGGKMELKSSPGEGTCLNVSVPFILERGPMN